MQPASSLSKTINNKVFASPIGLSSVIDPHMTGSKAFQELGFGFLEIGPIVLDNPATQNKRGRLVKEGIWSVVQNLSKKGKIE